MQRDIPEFIFVKVKEPKEKRMPCMGMINIKFNKMFIPTVRRRGEVRERGFYFICNVLVLKMF